MAPDLSASARAKHQASRIRTDIYLSSDDLFGTGELWCSGKGSARRDRGLSTGFINCLGQAEIDYLGCDSALLLKAYHNIAWLDVSMNELFLVYRSQTGGDLLRNFQGEPYFKRSRALDEILQGFSLYKLHGVEVTLGASPKWKTEATFGCRTLAAARASRMKRSRADSSPRYFSLMTFNVTGIEVDVERLVGYAHRAVT